MIKNHFYENKGPIPLKTIAKVVGYNNLSSDKENISIEISEGVKIETERRFVSDSIASNEKISEKNKREKKKK